jgi:hypothetical protein
MFTATTRDDGRVHIEYERTDGVNKLVDAIVVGPAQYAAWTEDDINAIIEQRWQDYLIAITPVPEPEIEEEVTDVEFTEGEE